MSHSQSPESNDLLAKQLGRRRVGILVLVVIVLLQVAVQFLAVHDTARAVTQVLFLSIEIPVLMVVLSFGYRWAIRRAMAPLRVVLFGVLAAGCVGACFGTLLWCASLFYPVIRFHANTSMQLTRAIAFGATFGQLHLGLWALAFVVPFAMDDAKLRSLESEKLRLEAEQLKSLAELAQLRANLEPHFLLNTLNAIAGLVTDEPKEARRLLVCLGDLLRDALHDDTELQPLEKQVDWLRRYAEILQARYPNLLEFSWNIANEVRSVPVPRLLLQPLVENAVKHGALKRQGGGSVVVSAYVKRGADSMPDSIAFSIEDNGPGIGEAERSTSFGLKAVRRRLQLKYGAAGTLLLHSTSIGTCALVELPIPASK